MTKDSSTNGMLYKTKAVSFGTGAMLLTTLAFPGAASAAEPRTNVSSVSTQDMETTSLRTDKFAGQVFDLMNSKRRAAGLPALTWNQPIADVSQAWANNLEVRTADPNFDMNTIHRADAGGSLIPKGANMYSEIIAFNFSAEQVVDWWMNSPGHKAAMLDKRSTHAGVGFVVPTSGPYKGWYLVVSNLAGYPSNVKPPAKPSPFSDLTVNHAYLNEMNWMFNNGISTGWQESNGSVTYRPFESVRRDAMAAFMYRLAGSPSYTPPARSPFSDVSTNNQFYKEIAWLDSQNISNGWTMANGTREYRPLEPVNRDAMAAFLYRLADSPAYTPPKTSPFTDVATNNQFYKEISWLAATGISTGWSVGNGKAEFRPNTPVNRDAMAAFMYRWAN